MAAFRAALGAGRAPLPACVHVFALPTLAPLHLGLLQAIAQQADVHVYALNPCREYWFEVIDRRRLGTLAVRGRDALHEEGNRLLAAWGKQAQAQLTLLVDAAGDGAVESSHFDRAGGDTLLARLHNAVLELVEIVAGAAGRRRPQHRGACVPLAGARDRGAARPAARPARQRHPRPARCWSWSATWTRPRR